MLSTQNTLFSLNEQNGEKIDYGFSARGSSPTSEMRILEVVELTFTL